MSKLKDNADELIQDIGQSFEEAQNTIQYRSQQQLMRYIRDPNWITKQFQARGKFKIDLLQLGRKELQTINARYERAFRMSLKNQEIPLNKEAVARLEEVKRQNANLMVSFLNQVQRSHDAFINKMQFDINGQKQIGELKESNKLADYIANALTKRDATEEVKITYSHKNEDGTYSAVRNVSFKAYGEMNARTTISQEISKQQMESAVNNGDVFWLCNSFEDCRPSHIAYQGKIYYDERYRDMGFNEEQLAQIEKAIDERGMQSRQSVEDNDPYLCNCPNCRHEFISVPIQDVVTMSNKELLKENNMEVTHATENKYHLSQIQRGYERKIRAQKFELEQAKAILDKTPSNPQAKAYFIRQKSKLDNSYKKIRALIKNNPFLERDYTRENAKILREDLGYRARKRNA